MLLRSWNEGTHRPFFPLCFRNAKGIGGSVVCGTLFHVLAQIKKCTW